MNHNLKALEAVWDYSYDKVGYLGTNIPIDHCYKCDYDGILKRLKMVINVHIVAIATLKLSMVKRTCGYLGNPVQRPVIEGRQKEICARVKHMKEPRS